LAGKKAALEELEGRMAAPDFWQNPEKAGEVVQDLKRLKAVVAPLEKTRRDLEELDILHDLALEEKNAQVLGEVEDGVRKVEASLQRIEIQELLSDEDDRLNAYVSIQSGAGGTESCDWANMMLRMYLRWIEDTDFTSELLSLQEAEEAGIKSATVHVKGPFAFGYLKSEMGVHRLVRISPFDAAKRRHTSFASVDVFPEYEEEAEVEILDSELRIDTYRSSGAGGQHVNVTDSAVRITHLPTGIVVQCQNERSQHKNRATAMKILKARLKQLKVDEREEEKEQQYESKGEIAFGSQIRSYVLQPYQIVKDHRTGHEVGNVEGVLDGNLDPFIEAYLRWRKSKDRERKKGSKG
jgi:peptide chain release factor 2